MTQYTPMIQQYLQIKANYPDAFLFFRLGDFYELFFEDAKLAAKELEITLTGRVGGGVDKIPMCGVPYHSSDQYISVLINKGYKVAICEQVEDPSVAKGVVKREVIRVVTPGTVMDQKMLKENENNYILFVARDDHELAIVACDISTGEVTGTQMNDLQLMLDEALHFQAAEMIVTGSFTDDEMTKIKGHAIGMMQKKTDDVTKKWKETVTIVHDQEQLSRAMWLALKAMFDYLNETQKRSLEHLQAFQYYQKNYYLHMDAYSKRNLELTETIRDHTEKGSLLWLLNETSTAMGGRLIKKWIQRPLSSRSQIEERLKAVSIFINNAFEREELEQLLAHVYDFERLAARVSYGNVNARDLLQLKKSLQTIPRITEQLSRFPTSYVYQLLERIDPCTELATLLEKALVDDPPLSLKEGGIFRKEYNQELDQLLDVSHNGKKWIADLEAKERQATGVKSLKVGFNKVFGYYIEVTKANIHLLEKDQYERKQTLANSERFITPELKEKEALIMEASDKLIDLEYRLFLELRSEVNGYIDRLQELAQIIAHIDVLCSFAKVSEKYHYVQPTFSENRSLSIIGGRHPVVEKVLNQSSFVANDLLMDDQEREILLITGPNMAGKSTYMRQTALIVIMAQIGCFVPATQAHLPLFDQIFTRIGAADDLVGGQSTFMVEMMETKRAITKATPNSLILLDEIGRGTSTYDGMSLAQAVIEYIHDHVQAKTLFSTHYHELTDLQYDLRKLSNVHVVCSEKNGRVIFLHTVKEGKTDRSYGIHVAQLADMPDEVIGRANQILAKLESAATTDHLSNEKDLQINEEKTGIDQVQLSFFAEDERLACLQDIENLDITTMTPLEALNWLYNWQQKIKNNS